MLAASHLTKQQVHISSWILQFQSPVRWSIVGWAYPSEKWWSESQLGWWNIWNSQYDGKVIKFHGSKAPSSIYIYHINSTVSDFFCSIRLVLKKHHFNDPRNDPMLQFPTQFPGSLLPVYLDPRPLSCVPAMRLTVDAAKNWICAGSKSQNHWCSFNGRLMVA